MVLRRELVLFVAIVLTVGLLLGAATFSQQFDQGKEQGQPVSGEFAPCFNLPELLNTSLNRLNGTIGALQLNPGSAGSLCLDYRFNATVRPDFKPVISLVPAQSSNGTNADCVNSAWNVSETCLGIFLSYSVIKEDPGRGLQAVSLNVSTDATIVNQGVYWLWIGQGCEPIVLYIGQPPAKISLQQAGGYILCTMVSNLPTVQIVGYRGFGFQTLKVDY